MTTDTRQPYVLQAIDPETRCVAYETKIHDLAKFCQLVEFDPADLEPGACYAFDAAEVARVMDACGVECKAGGLPGLLRPWCAIDQLPYKVHTDRELVMMLAGTKPLAVFSDEHPSARPPYEIIPEDLYAPYVEAGRFVMREVIIPPSNPSTDPATRIVLYALPTEQWRIDAYLLLRRTGYDFGWSEACERMEGTLLGYSNEQNDIYIEMIYRRRRAAKDV